MCDSIVGNASTSTSPSSKPPSLSQLPQHKQKQHPSTIVRRSRHRRRASIETSSPSMINPPMQVAEPSMLSLRDLSIQVESDPSLCVDVGRSFRRDSLLVSKRSYMSKSSERIILGQDDDQGEAPKASPKRRVRFAAKAKAKIISRVDDADPHIAREYWADTDDRALSQQRVVEETKMFRKLHKITKSRRRQSLQEGGPSKLSSTQHREEEMIWAIIDAKSYCVRGLEQFIDRRMWKKLKEEQEAVVDVVLRTQDEHESFHPPGTPGVQEKLASVSASLTKDARLRASLMGMEDQEAVQAMRWEEEQRRGKGPSSSFR